MILKPRDRTLLWGALFSCSIAVLPQHLYSQSRYEVAIVDISYTKVHKNWLLLPTSADVKVSWSVMLMETIDNLEREVAKDPSTLPLTYQVVSVESGDGEQPSIVEIQDASSVLLRRQEIGITLKIKVRAYDSNSDLVSESEFATVVVGKGDMVPGLANRQGFSYYLHPGRWQLATIGKADIYDKSTTLGKLAFLFLSITGLLSCLILLFYSSRTLYLGNIFPYKRSARSLFWSFTLSCDMSYTHRITNKFKFVLNAWEMIATNSKRIADRAIKSIPKELSSTEKIASVDVACMEYWTSDGDEAIGTIADILAFPQSPRTAEKKNPDALLTELVVKIEDNFHDLLLNGGSTGNGSGKANYGTQEREDIAELVDEIYEPVLADEKPFSRLKKRILRSGLFDLNKGLQPFPTSKIIQAGLEIHRMNGYRWSKSSEEVKRAFEDRASNEIEILKHKSKIEWFWNYATLAPLVGLFGTVTGITYAFQQLSQTNGSPDFSNTIQLLSNGIFEALWTTIFGLANSIVFIVVYHYFKHKLDWIFSKWEDVYVSITEKL